MSERSKIPRTKETIDFEDGESNRVDQFKTPFELESKSVWSNMDKIQS